MAVTDLTNTKWLLNSIPTKPSTDLTFSINFISNNNSYTQLKLYHSAVVWNDNGIYYDDLSVYGDYVGWNEGEVYRTIEITGGTDVTNTNLIAWLEANATQIEEPSSDVIETTISVGTSLLSDASIGTTKLLKAYIGNHLIFERLGGNFLTSDGKLLLTSDNKIFNVQEAVTIISFTIGNSVFQAEEGMNWGDWVQSSYNTEGLTIVTGGYVNWPGSGYVLLGFEQVRYDELIIANEVYRTSGEND